MSKFPHSIELPPDIYLSRRHRYQAMIQSARFGIILRLIVIIIELYGVFLVGSSSLFLDAIASLIDIVSSFFLIYCIKLAKRPPDHDHPFGHGRYEPMGGLLLGILLTVMGVVMITQQAFALFQESRISTISPIAWIFSLIAMILLETAYHVLLRTARLHNSPALIADAIHFRMDSLTSLCATITLLIVAYTPYWSVVIDHVGALLIAIIMIVMGIFASRKNFHQLMDKIPENQLFQRVKESAMKTDGVKGTEKIRIQQYGPDAHINIDIEVDPHLTIEKAHQISQLVRLEIQKEWTAVRDVIVHIEPYYPNDH